MPKSEFRQGYVRYDWPDGYSSRIQYVRRKHLKAPTGGRWYWVLYYMDNWVTSEWASTRNEAERAAGAEDVRRASPSLVIKGTREDVYRRPEVHVRQHRRRA